MFGYINAAVKEDNEIINKKRVVKFHNIIVLFVLFCMR
jgi:hypothetical protein